MTRRNLFISWWLFISLVGNFFIENEGAIVNGPNGGAGFLEAGDACRQVSKTSCEPLQVTTCFGVKLPYTETSSELVKFNATQSYLQKELTRWEGLRFSPKCWAVIQPLLCSVYMPKCLDGIIELPSQETCKSTRSTCKLVEQDLGGWPEFLKCDDFTKFPTNCKHTEIRELKFNTSTVCMDPMIQVENSFNHYDGFEGCALKCQDSLFTEEDHESVSKIIFYGGILLLVLNGGSVITYLMEWNPSVESKSVFYANLYYCVATTGWMLQYLPNGKFDIVCRKDGTIRREEIGQGENVFCVFVFVVIYGGSLSALQWLIVFAYNLNRKCKLAERSRLSETPTHGLIWLFTIFLVIIAVSVGKVGGSSITGICFIGEDSSRRLFIIALFWVLTFGTVYLFSNCAYRLYKLPRKFITGAEKKEMNSKIYRCTFSSLMFTVMAITLLFLEIRQATEMPLWEKSLRESIVCRMNLTEMTECSLKNKPGLISVFVSVLLYFCGGVLTSSWAWTGASWRIWIRFISRCCRCGDPHSTEYSTNHRNKFLTKAFPNRKHFTNGRHSQSVQNMYEDPVGLDKLLDPARLGKDGADADQQSRRSFPTNTEGTGDMSSSDFGAATTTPNCVNRRGGLIPLHSFATCQSEDSRRPSCDSAGGITDLAAKQLQGSNSTLDEYSNRRGKRRWFQMRKLNRKGKSYSYGGSSTSMESNGGAKILPAITRLIDKKLGRPENVVQTNNQLLPLKKAILVKELAIQTSFEKLSILPPLKHNSNTPSNNLTMCDKATQSSLRSLLDSTTTTVGTQTKKSATKKKDKKRGKDCKKNETAVTVDNEESLPENQANDPVLKLLSPTPN